jgi:hypothetical protein
MRALIVDHVTGGGEEGHEVLLQVVARVIGADGDAQ